MVYILGVEFQKKNYQVFKKKNNKKKKTDNTKNCMEILLKKFVKNVVKYMIEILMLELLDLNLQ